MVYTCVGNKSQALLIEPFPVDNVLVHGGRFQLLFLSQVKDLKSPRLRLERDNLLVPVHDRTVGLDWAPDDIVVVLEFDDDYLRRGALVDLLANTDIVIRFQCLVQTLVIETANGDGTYTAVESYGRLLQKMLVTFLASPVLGRCEAHDDTSMPDWVNYVAVSRAQCSQCSGN